MSDRLRVGVIFGGRSGEHAVSLMSARSIMRALCPQKYEVIPIGITVEGRWLIHDKALTYLEQKVNSGSADEEGDFSYGTLVADPAMPYLMRFAQDKSVQKIWHDIDVFFPVLHGTFGEDGAIQGLFELAGVPYVGSGVAASAIGMDKVHMKAAFAAAGMPQLPYVVVHRVQYEANALQTIEYVADTIGFPCFVKPANLGSSVGISKATDVTSLHTAIEEAARYDRKIIIEEAALHCCEVEVSILGNENPRASIPGEIVPSNEFYDYKAKYIDGRSELHIPARIDEEKQETVRALAVKAFEAIDGAGLARVDFFVQNDGPNVYLNEVNTMPGFTRMSMYPKLWEASGMSFESLVDELIQLAFQRHKEDKRSLRTFPGT